MYPTDYWPDPPGAETAPPLPVSTFLAAWLGVVEAIPSAERAALAWARIQEKPTSVVLKPASGANRAAQTVRVESDSAATPAESAAGGAPKRKVVVFGIRGHATLSDTVMAEGDRFVYLNDLYTCVDTIVTIGEIQGIFEAVG